MPRNERTTIATAFLAAALAAVAVQARPDLLQPLTVAVAVFVAMLAFLRLS
jgi:hypothetical protein